MKMKKISMLVVLVITLIMLFTTGAYAANFDLDVYFNGKTISMQSEQTQMGLNISNLLPGQTDTSYLKVSNKGSKEVKLFFTASLENDEGHLLNVLTVSIKDSNGTEIFDGDYTNFNMVELPLQAGESETYTIITTLSKEAGNEYQNKQANVKFSFEARGEETQEPKKEIVTTEIVKPQTGQSRIIYAVLIAIVIVLVVILIMLAYNKKDKKSK